MNNLNLINSKNKKNLFMFISLDISQVQVFNLSLIIKQVKLKHNNIFMNKLTNMRA